jgi:NAD(P)-dependent dehydrogenase (short-subunit alcohol dehydrogenase family)
MKAKTENLEAVKEHPEIEQIKDVCRAVLPESKDKHDETLQPPQTQDTQPGMQYKMHPKPISIRENYKGADKLKDKVALITGGDSGIGRAVAYHFAKEGAKVVIIYLDEDTDAQETCNYLTQMNCPHSIIKGDVRNYEFCQQTIATAIEKFGKLDCIVNNAAIQFEQDEIGQISPEQLDECFRTNLFGYFYMIQAAMPHLTTGSTIINTTSVTAYRGSKHLIDYSATKGAIVTLTRSLALSVVDKGIRVNGVAPGPVWTPLIPASFSEEKVAKFGCQVPMKRAAQPAEIAPCYVFLASEDSSYMTGQVLHPNGGEVINT